MDLKPAFSSTPFLQRPFRAPESWPRLIPCACTTLSSSLLIPSASSGGEASSFLPHGVQIIYLQVGILAISMFGSPLLLQASLALALRVGLLHPLLLWHVLAVHICYHLLGAKASLEALNSLSLPPPLPPAAYMRCIRPPDHRIPGSELLSTSAASLLSCNSRNHELKV